MIERRRLGGSTLEVSAIGLGCMSMSGAYGPGDDAQSIAVIHRALDLGVNFLDSSDMYGWGHNETLLGQALRGRRERAVVVTKFGNMRKPDGTPGVDGRPEWVPQACDASLKRLGVDVIDLYYQHRVDPKVPIEDTVGAMSRLVEAGKVHKLADLPADDRRRQHPRFEETNLQRNVEFVKKVEQFAREKGCTPGQLVLAWLLAQGGDVVPIPGTKRRDRLEENVGAAAVQLSADEVKRISDAVPTGAASGLRYPEPQMKAV